MKINYYFLIVGIFSILFSFTHAWNGQTAVLPLVDLGNLDLNTKTTIFYVWHIITLENFIFGVAFLLMAFNKDISKVKFTAKVIAIIMVARWSVILWSITEKNPSGQKDILMDIIVINVFILLIVLGMRVKNKVIN
jgi:hypothetical protein